MSGLDLRGIFEKVTEHTIVINPAPLRLNYIPQRILGRNAQIRDFARALLPVIQGERTNIVVHGKTGTGKTMTARALEKEVNTHQIKTCYINCNTRNTTYRVIAGLLRELGVNVPFTGWPTDKLSGLLDSHEEKMLVFFDEVDKLREDKVLYQLSRRENFSMVMITNDLDFQEKYDPRVLSSLTCEKVFFKPYNADELALILRQRAEKAFTKDAWSEEVIGFCSALAAREYGDARKAIEMLRTAARLAERNNQNEITIDDVQTAAMKVEEDGITEIVKTLPAQEKAILYAIAIHGETNTGEVYQTYKRNARLFGIQGTHVLTKRRVSDLISDLAMLSIIDAETVSHGRHGRTKEIQLRKDPQRIIGTLAVDYGAEALFRAYRRAGRMKA